MSFQKLILTINRQTGEALRDFSSSVLFNLPSVKQSDNLDIDFRLVEPTRDASQPWRYIDLSTYTVRAAIGNPGSGFTNGTFTVSYDGETSATSLPYTATPAQLQTNLNAIATIAAAGGVTVSGGTKSPYKILFNEVGAKELIGFDTDGLFPRADSQSFLMVEGDVSTRQIQFVSFSLAPATISEDFVDLPAASASINVISAGGSGSNEIVEINLSDPEPYDGVYRFTYGGETSFIIDHDADAEVVKAAIEAMPSVGADNVLVSGSFPIFTVEFVGTLANTDIIDFLIDASALKVAVGKRGSLDLDQPGIYELLSDSSSVRTKLEVELLDPDEKVFTACQLDVTVINDILSNSPAPSASPAFHADYVSYRPQAPSDARVQQALQNLNIASFDDLASANATLTIGKVYYDRALQTLNVATA